MASVNKVILIGNLGRDPEMRSFPDGGTICNVTLATTRSWKDKNSGDKVEETEWHRIVFRDRLAEIAGEYLKKGRQVYIEGSIRSSKYTDKEGVERWSTDIIANNMQMLGGAGEGGGARGEGGGGYAPRPQSAGRPAGGGAHGAPQHAPEPPDDGGFAEGEIGHAKGVERDGAEGAKGSVHGFHAGG